MNKKTAIIGGGASGLAAACLLSKFNEVVVCEKGDRVGKKLLATGNGRCNLMNTNFSSEHFNSHSPELVKKFIHNSAKTEIFGFFNSLGLLTREDSEGRLYPLSNQSSGVLDLLRFTALENGVVFRTDFDVQRIERYEDGFGLFSEDGTQIIADKVILACGGKASAVENSKSIELLCHSLGHTLTELKPVLVPIKSDKSFCSALKGIRSKVKISLKNQNKIYAESGEILFTEYGISGIAAMQLSRRLQKGCSLLIDFAEEYSATDILTLLRLSKEKGRCAENLAIGILPRRVMQQIIKRVLKIGANTPACEISDEMLTLLASKIKSFPLAVYGTLSWENAQVMSGGISLCEVNTESMESLLQKGLYIIGELLDIDGECGGYNLGWAWLSAIKAANSINKERSLC